MDEEQFSKLKISLDRIAAATLATAVLNRMVKKPTLKETQSAFNDCFMIVSPELGTTQQDTFQARLDKVEW